MTTGFSQRVGLSKAVAHALRHDPAAYGLTLDENGWTSASDVVEALRRRSRRWTGLSYDALADMVEHGDKRRYELDGDRIRALYGHSLPGRVTHPTTVPPRTLYHGTTAEALRQIRRDGLLPMARQYVHLSADVATARAVGSRRSGAPVVVTVDAERAAAAGVAFCRGNAQVWLAARVPVEFLGFPEDLTPPGAGR